MARIKSGPESLNREQEAVWADTKLAAESSLEAFIRLVAPNCLLGDMHLELINWMTREEAKSHQLILLPRDHQKSRIIAYRAAWEITRDPSIKILLISSTSRLAEKQLKFIKDMLLSPVYRRYWPEMVNWDEGRREKWSQSEISVDHPKRQAEALRDPTVFTGGLTTSLTGLHCDIAILDDVVVYENAYTQEGRTLVESQYSLLSSIEGTDSKEWVVGTHYHAKDLYVSLKDMQEEEYNKEGDIIGKRPVYEVFERKVEDIGDGTGTFLWPRQQRADGKWFGFNREILAQKRAKYLDRAQFRAQYYNDPNDTLDAPIDRSRFQYYDKKHLVKLDGNWYFKDKRLNVFASIDFAFSLSKQSDYTALVVIGIDSDNQYYILDIVRFKSDKISDYYQTILDMHAKWEFRKLRAECTAAQAVIVKDIRSNYLIPNGMALSIDEYHPTRHEGSKEERISATLQPRYNNQQIWHYQGGECSNLEDELVQRRPSHDDIKDALTSAIAIAVPPSSRFRSFKTISSHVATHPKFGGVMA